MSALGPADVIDALIEILNGELGRLGVRSDLQAVATQIQQDEIGEGIQPWIFETAVGQGVVITVEAHPELIDERRSEGVVLAEGEKMEPERLDSIEGGKV